MKKTIVVIMGLLVIEAALLTLGGCRGSSTQSQTVVVDTDHGDASTDTEE